MSLAELARLPTSTAPWRRVEELTGDRPIGNLDDFISQEELRALSDRYKRIAGYSIEDLATPSAA